MREAWEYMIDTTIEIRCSCSEKLEFTRYDVYDVNSDSPTHSLLLEPHECNEKSCPEHPKTSKCRECREEQLYKIGSPALCMGCPNHKYLPGVYNA